MDCVVQHTPAAEESPVEGHGLGADALQQASDTGKEDAGFKCQTHEGFLWLCMCLLCQLPSMC